jgi:hypothetical protein
MEAADEEPPDSFEVTDDTSLALNLRHDGHPPHDPDVAHIGSIEQSGTI